MPSFPAIVVRHPQPHDLVDDPVGACGIGTGFEAVFAARVRDANGTELAQVSIHAGGTGIWGNFHAELPLGAVPATPQGTLEVYGFHAGTGEEVGKVVVPIVFGRALVDPYHGFAPARGRRQRYPLGHRPAVLRRSVLVAADFRGQPGPDLRSRRRSIPGRRCVSRSRCAARNSEVAR